MRKEIEEIINKYIGDVFMDSGKQGNIIEPEHLQLLDLHKKELVISILSLFEKKIDDIPKTELLMTFDKYRSRDKDGDIVLYGVYFIDIVLDIINIIKSKVKE